MARPAKRRSVSVSEEPDDVVEESPVKRVKLERVNGTRNHDEEEDMEDDEEDGVAGEGEGVDVDVDRGEGSGSGGSDDGEDEFEDDAANLQAFEEARQRQRKYAHLESDVGVIKQVVLVDFMCHRHLKVDFGPRMNFLVGHNGSGKSAILTAIAVALGGKAALTGRGTGMKDLIRKGCDKAVITITICNEGYGAYKSDVYDPNIVIERTITKTGGGYKFKSSKDGRTVATKREELAQILASLNVNVDSPLTVLTQDQARSFLSNADDAMLYRFFLNGTGLQSLYDSYQRIEQDFQKLKVFKQRSLESVPDLEARVASLKRKVQASRLIIEQAARKDLICNELAWAYVISKEKERDTIMQQVQAIEDRIAQTVEQIDIMEGKLKPLEVDFERVKDEVAAFEKTREPLFKAQRQAKAAYDHLSNEMTHLNHSEYELEQDFKSVVEEITQLEQKLAAKIASMNAGMNTKQLEDQKRLTQVDQRYHRFKAEEPRCLQTIQELTRKREAAEEAVSEIEAQQSELLSQLQSARQGLINMERASSDRLNKFGENVHLVMNEINKANWRNKPVGPMGLHVQLDDQAYRQAFESMLGSMLCTWVVTCDADKETLRNILSACRQRGYRAPGGNGIPIVFSNSGDIFDYSTGDLSRHGPTVLSKLTFSNELVKRTVINAAKIEKIFAAPNNRTADGEIDRMLRMGMTQVTFVTADGYRLEGTPRARTSNPLQPWQGNSLFSANIAADIQAKKAEVEGLKRETDAVGKKKTDATAGVTQITAQLGADNLRLAQIRNGIQGLRVEKDRLQDELEAQPSDEVGALEEAKREMLRKRDGLNSQREAVVSDRNELQARIEASKAELAEAKQKYDDYLPERRRRQDALAAVGQQHGKAKQDLIHWMSHKERDENKLAHQRDLVPRVEEEVEDWTARAEAYCQRLEPERSTDELNREKTALEKAIAEAEKRQGVSIEDLTPQYNEAEMRLKETKDWVEGVGELTRLGDLALKARKKWWAEWRMNLAVKTRCAFILNCAKRSLDGRLVYNHHRGELSVRMYTPGKNTDTQAEGTQQEKFKTAKSLSGGERSFATVSLLLALWDTSTSPLRCLDEWDVFLDHVNRNIAAKMLIDGAKESDGRQFILITPQDMSGVPTGGEGNKVIRLSDPTRNQGTLSFPGA